jgi:hypothetical protein
MYPHIKVNNQRKDPRNRINESSSVGTTPVLTTKTKEIASGKRPKPERKAA